MTSFYRYPHTPHLAWLGSGNPRNDKVLTHAERNAFLNAALVVEEKVDGANIGFSVSENGDIKIQNRGSYLERDRVAPQFRTVFRWLDFHADALRRNLGDSRILFGEWCYAVHTVRYTQLPDWFLAFDVYDQKSAKFLTAGERDAVIRQVGIELVPRLATGLLTFDALKGLLGTSTLGAERGEGLYLRWGNVSFRRAKLVTPAFTQSVAEHWSKRLLQTNSLAEQVPSY